MGIDVKTLAAAKKYTKESLLGAGAIMGMDGFSPVIMENARNDNDNYRLDITDNNGTFTTQNLKGNKGKDGENGLSPTISANPNNNGNTYKLDITDINGTFTTGNLKGEQGVQGAQGLKGDKGDRGIQGEKGDKGDAGYPFLIYKEYSDISEFNSNDFPEIGLMFLIKTAAGNSFPVYRYTGEQNSPYSFITNLSGNESIKGDKGDKGDKGENGITYTPQIGTVTTVSANNGASANITINDTDKTATFDFSIPKGNAGEKGEPGATVGFYEKPDLATENIEEGKIRFCTDTNELFVDYGNAHIEISDFIKEYTEEEILITSAPLPKIYIAKDTLNMFYYTTEWIKLNKSSNGSSNFSDNIRFILGMFDSKNIPHISSKGDMYYNKDNRLIYTAINAATWDNGSDPQEKYIYVNLDNKTMYVYQNNRMMPYGTEAPYIYDTIIDKNYTWSSKQIVDYIDASVLGGES